MTHMDGKGMNILEENIKRLKELFPEIVTEGKVDFDMLRQVLGDYVEEDKEAYSFTWSGKGRALRHSQTPSSGTLRPAKEESKDWDSTQNLYIEGDNLEVLKLLQKSYFGRIKMIYIDPPYNTGKDFVYEDDYRDSIKNYKKLTGQLDSEGKSVTTNPETSGRYHRDWLNMMYPRLRLAKNLLKDDGVIFISMDDNEVTNLRKLCDEVFGENNFITELVRKTKTMTGDEGSGVNLQHEYVMVYSKDVRKLFLLGELKDFTNYSNPDNDVNGEWVTADPSARSGGTTTSFPITNPITGQVDYPPIGRYWAFSEQTLKGYIESGRVKFRAEKTSGRSFVFKRYKKDLSSMNNPVDSLFFTSNEFLNEVGTRENKILFDGTIYFDYPKPEVLVRKLTQFGTDKDSIILDFFSGSATTAHAVMQINAEDGGNRKFIMVQLPEETDPKSEACQAGYHNICEIGKERIRRAGELVKKQALEAWNAAGMEQRQQMKNPDELDIGFKVFKLDSTNLIKWNPDRENLEASLLDYVDNLEPGRSEEDLLYEVMLKTGIDLSWPIETYDAKGKTIYSIGLGALMVCLSNQVSPQVAEEMVRLKAQLQPETWKVVFKDSGFADDMAKTNIKETLKNAGLADDAFTTL